MFFSTAIEIVTSNNYKSHEYFTIPCSVEKKNM